MSHLTRDEMWQVARRLRPALSRDAFDRMWNRNYLKRVARERGRP